MHRLIGDWISRQFKLGDLTTRFGVLRFSVSLSLKCLAIANVGVVILHLVLDAFGLLPYPLAQALVVGVAATTIITMSVTLFAGYVFGRAIREIAISRDDFERLSSTDMLSGLRNRRSFFERLENVACDSVFVLFDIDRFKSINDLHGHLVGDEVIAAIGHALRTVLAASNADVARLGGEEFAMIVSEEAGGLHLAIVAEAAAAISRLRIASVPDLRVTVSGGLSTLSRGRSVTEAYSAADRALYVAKASGRNRIVHEDEIVALTAAAEPAARAIAC